MEQVNRHINRAVIRFSQWSRKNWAVFNSLGRVVSIGHLDVPVVGQALRKTLLSGSVLTAEYIYNDSNEVDQDDQTESLLLTLGSLLTVLLVSVLAVDLPSPVGELSLYHITLFDLPLAVSALAIAISSWKWLSIVLPKFFTQNNSKF